MTLLGLGINRNNKAFFVPEIISPKRSAVISDRPNGAFASASEGPFFLGGE